ncbi:hypothetical protein Y032_0042g509 [Ancylostoma ceylanicum]|uniref:Uncharacterized protein n=1 Tax=Ancylostoma ceylanicum TaxID=53326 RepID=A0A016UFS1_9BILA|nr:hypothetical protein Y032_0042g509 [Ancylostoma ceylanicum]
MLDETDVSLTFYFLRLCSYFLKIKFASYVNISLKYWTTIRIFGLFKIFVCSNIRIFGLFRIFAYSNIRVFEKNISNATL